VAISNSRLLSLDERGVSFRWKDYRQSGKMRRKTMTLSPDEFLRRFLLHVLPGGFHRIRHYGWLANGNRKASLTRVRALLGTGAPPERNSTIGAQQTTNVHDDDEGVCITPSFVCRHCGGAMNIIQTLLRTTPIRAPPPP
jgi:hypothetical protein